MFQLAPPDDDGLFIPEVGPWSADKHHFLRRYMDAFTVAMHKKRWSALHYVDLFAGAGIERLKGDGLDWGSPLIAAQVPHQFAQLHLCEKNSRSFEALSQRVVRYAQPKPPQLLRGDANNLVRDITDAVPDGCLTLAFLDPYGLHLHFKTLVTLATKRSDLIIFFPDHLDALRNWENAYVGQPDSNLNLVLGTDAWLERMLAQPKDQWPFVLRSIYVEQIRSIGYKYFDYERITRSDGAPLYLLIYCSRDKTGGLIWRRVAAMKPGGQGTFSFD